MFGAILADAGIKVILSGIQVPRMNAIMVRWVRACHHELLDRTLIYDQQHLLHALQEYERFYNLHRPHQGSRTFDRSSRCLNRSPTRTGSPTEHSPRDRLSGVRHEYEHAA